MLAVDSTTPTMSRSFDGDGGHAEQTATCQAGVADQKSRSTTAPTALRWWTAGMNRPIATDCTVQKFQGA